MKLFKKNFCIFFLSFFLSFFFFFFFFSRRLEIIKVGYEWLTLRDKWGKGKGRKEVEEEEEEEKNYLKKKFKKIIAFLKK